MGANTEFAQIRLRWKLQESNQIKCIKILFRHFDSLTEGVFNEKIEKKKTDCLEHAL